MESISDPRQSKSILLVEDELDTLKVLSTIFAMKFPDVALHTANNGRTGLELFKTHRPDIVITDVNMPEMGGVQMAERILAIKPDTKFIVLSGDAAGLVLQDSTGEEFEVGHYIAKPVSFTELFATIEQCLDEITQQNNLQGT